MQPLNCSTSKKPLQTDTTQPTQHRYFVLHKPYNMVSQFVSTHHVGLLTQINFTFPPGTHAVGRLDNHSEGLLLLTTNKKITKLLFESSTPHKRVYLALVKHQINAEQLQQLQTGVTMPSRGGGYYTSLPCDVKIIEPPVFSFTSHYTLNNYIDYTWLQLTLTEGKFRQVRKMLAAVKSRCVRLIRIAIEEIELGNLLPGAVIEMNEADFFRLLHLENKIEQ